MSTLTPFGFLPTSLRRIEKGDWAVSELAGTDDTKARWELSSMDGSVRIRLFDKAARGLSEFSVAGRSFYYHRRSLIGKGRSRDDKELTDAKVSVATQIAFACRREARRATINGSCSPQQQLSSAQAQALQDLVERSRDAWMSSKEVDEVLTVGPDESPVRVHVFGSSGRRLFVMVLADLANENELAKEGVGKRIIPCFDWLTGEAFVRGRTRATEDSQDGFLNELAFYRRHRTLPGIAEQFRYLKEEMIEGFRVFTYFQRAYSGDLTELVRDHSLDTEQRIAVGADVALTLAIMHERGVVHRDVKLDNVLYYMDDGGIHTAVCDFGTAQIQSSLGSTGISYEMPILNEGTPGYLPPENEACSRLHSFAMEEMRNINNSSSQSSSSSPTSTIDRERRSLLLNDIRVHQLKPVVDEHRFKRDSFAFGVLLLSLFSNPMVDPVSAQITNLFIKDETEVRSPKDFPELYASLQHGLDAIVAKVREANAEDLQAWALLDVAAKLLKADPAQRASMSEALEECMQLAGAKVAAGSPRLNLYKLYVAQHFGEENEMVGSARRSESSRDLRGSPMRNSELHRARSATGSPRSSMLSPRSPRVLLRGSSELSGISGQGGV